VIGFRKPLGLPTFSWVPPHARVGKSCHVSTTPVAMSDSNRRQTFRIDYPRGASPTFDWSGELLRVVDCSERGFRVEVPKHLALPSLEDQLLGRIRFPDQSTVGVCGIVRHRRGRVVGVHFDDPGVPWRVMLKEQLRLRAEEWDGEHAGERKRVEVAVYRRR